MRCIGEYPKPASARFYNIGTPQAWICGTHSRGARTEAATRDNAVTPTKMLDDFKKATDTVFLSAQKKALPLAAGHVFPWRGKSYPT